MAMSNHVHLAVGDTTADRSEFMQDVWFRAHRLLLGAGVYGDTVLLDDDCIDNKLLYIWLNPVRAGLVERAEDWPGFKILPRHWGETIRIETLGKFYGRKNPGKTECARR